MRVFLRGSTVLAVCFASVLASAQAPSQPEATATASATLSPAQQVAQGEAIAQRAQRLAERLMKMLEAARKEGDVVRANCLNNKLKEVNAGVRSVNQRVKSLQDAAASGDTEKGQHAFTVLNVLAQRLDTLEQEAVQCLGKDALEAGPSQVVTTVPADSPTDDPFAVPPEQGQPPSVTVPPPLTPAR